mgnify:CR=1 FL=1
MKKAGVVIMAEPADAEADLTLELYAANERIDLLAGALGRPVEVVQAAAVAASSASE